MLVAMDTQTSPSISSFVIRFVVDPGSSTYRGEIRHIQTGEEVQFTDWQDVETFVGRYVLLEGKSGAGSS
jgi:hypothetical protein